MSDRKRCTQCGQHKQSFEFSPCRNTLQPACRECRNATARTLKRAVTAEDKACRVCGRLQPASNFNRSNQRRDGLQSECKQCTNERKKACRYPVTLAHKACRQCGITKEASEFCRDKKRVGGLRAECRECSGIINRAAVYGIPIAQAERMCAVERCEICNKQFGSVTEKNLDHCHETGRMRGTLCGDCNKLLGCAKDDPQTLRNAARYLNGHIVALGRRNG